MRCPKVGALRTLAGPALSLVCAALEFKVHDLRRLSRFGAWALPEPGLLGIDGLCVPPFDVLVLKWGANRGDN